jgi:hypothetical protein
MTRRAFAILLTLLALAGPLAVPCAAEARPAQRAAQAEDSCCGADSCCCGKTCPCSAREDGRGAPARDQAPGERHERRVDLEAAGVTGSHPVVIEEAGAAPRLCVRMPDATAPAGRELLRRIAMLTI